MTDVSDTVITAGAIPYSEHRSGGLAAPETLLRLSYPWLIVAAFGRVLADIPDPGVA